MKRSLLVVAGTAAGVTAVVSYHATTARSVPGLSGSAAAGTSVVTTHSSHSATSPAATATAPATTATSPATTAAATTTPTTSSAATTDSSSRSAVGEAVSFQYGQVAVKVTEREGKITNVAIASFSIGNARSQSIDVYAVPRLRAEVLAAQSAHIDGVSGASYTSQAYAESVQSALDKLS